MGDVLTERRSWNHDRLEAVRSEVAGSELAGACVYVTGSFARGEASAFSDLDLFIVSADGDERLCELDAICLKADLIRATKDLALPPFSGDGAYLQIYPLAKLVDTLGRPEDDSTNTFTARMLLLLESEALLGASVYHTAIVRVIDAYWRDFEDHSDSFMPAFLANDILRLWRTFCVNYEARTKTGPDDLKAKRKLKNYKLKHSRLLTCYSALAYLLLVYVDEGTVHRKAVEEMVAMSPTRRIEWIAANSRNPAAGAPAQRVLATYEEFLSNSAKSEAVLIETFLDGARAKELMKGATRLSVEMFDLLAAVGSGYDFYRLLVV